MTDTRILHLVSKGGKCSRCHKSKQDFEPDVDARTGSEGLYKKYATGEEISAYGVIYYPCDDTTGRVFSSKVNLEGFKL